MLKNYYLLLINYIRNMWYENKENFQKLIHTFNSGNSSESIESRVPYEINMGKSLKWIKQRTYEILEVPSNNPHKIDLLNSLNKLVVGQNEAKQKILDSILNSTLSIRPRKWPISVLFLVWPTWVWKTEIVKALAQTIFGDRESITKISCETYTERYTVSNMFWSAKWYVWYKEDTPFSPNNLFKSYEKAEKRGSLHKCVKNLNNFNIILFDEIEKANPIVIQSLLGVIDEGKINFPSGETSCLSNSIIFFTSNIWQSEINNSLYKSSIWFVPNKIWNSNLSSERIFNDSMRTNFSPEFIWRLNEIIIFDSISINDCKKIIEIQVSEINESLKDFYKESRVNIVLDSSIYKYILDLWYTKEKWAREIIRVFKTEFESKLNLLLHSEKFFQYLCSSWNIKLNASFNWEKIFFKLFYNSNRSKFKNSIKGKANILNSNNWPILPTLSDIYSLCCDYVAYCNIDMQEGNSNYSNVIREIQNKLVNFYWFSLEDINILRKSSYMKHLGELDFINTFEFINVYSRKNKKLFYPYSQKTIYSFVKSKIHKFIRDEEEICDENIDRIIYMIIDEVISLFMVEDLSPRQSSEVITYIKKIISDYYG